MLVDKVKDVGGLVIKKAPPEDKKLALKEIEFTNSVMGSHHSKLECHGFKGVGMVGGCGVMHLYEVHNLNVSNPDSVKSEFKNFLKRASTHTPYACKTFIARLGVCKHENGKYSEFYIGVEKLLLELGFKMISEYHNYAHKSYPSHYQRLYIYTDI